MIGIQNKGQTLCDTQNGNVKPSFYVKIPDRVLEWILKIGGNDIKNEQEDLKCWSNEDFYFYLSKIFSGF